MASHQCGLGRSGEFADFLVRGVLWFGVFFSALWKVYDCSLHSVCSFAARR